jgi:hypothetical protein
MEQMGMNVDLFAKTTVRDHFGNRPAAWPTTRAERGKYYSMPDPIHAGDQLVVMSHTTWVDFGTMLEVSRRAGVEMDKRVKELIGENKVLTAQAANYKDKLEAIQDIRRKEKTKAAYKSHGVTYGKSD